MNPGSAVRARLALLTFRVVSVLYFVALGICSATAQTVTATTGGVNGVVTDTTNAVMPGVSVRLSGEALMTPRTTLTDGTGAYRFSAVPPGDHTLTFELAGFLTVHREAVHIGLGFTATVNVEMSPGAVSDSITVSGSPVVDLASTTVTTHFDAAKLVTFPGARDTFSVLGNTPGIAMAKMDVGGNGALVLQDYTAYGLRATTGVHRSEVEGIRVGGANGTSDNYFSDYGSFAEIAITAVGQTAAMPVPGILAQYVSKSGANTYHGSLYADYQGDRLQATNIDDRQIARGLTGGPNLDVKEVNRLQRFRDFTADTGGYLRRDKLWWYGGYRSTAVAQRYAWLLDTAATQSASVGTGKITYLLSPRQRIIGYLQYQKLEQSDFFLPGTAQPIQRSESLPSIVFPVRVWKGDYNVAVNDVLYVEARVGAYHSGFTGTSKSAEPRVADVGANTVRGGAVSSRRLIDRPQANGSVSVLKNGWGGSHTFRIGGEYAVDRNVVPNYGYGHPCNCLSTFNNSVPAQVQVQQGANVSKNDVTTAAGFVDDTWRLNRRITLSLGIRLDRYQPGLPEQVGPASQMFPAIDPVLTFSNWGPRSGMSADLTGDGKTVLKLQYGTFWVYPAPNFTAAINPNPSGWSRTYLWPRDTNGNGRWDQGEEGALTAVSGGSATTRLDLGIENTFVHQASAYLEREVAPTLGLRTGVVINARRQPYGTINVSRPLDAYAVPVAVSDPGPDGRLGSADDGPTLTAYDLIAAASGVPPVNLTTNLPEGNSEFYTWEVTATKRQTARWSLLASFTETWSRQAALGTGNDFTPNALINSAGTQDRFTTWQAKVHGTILLPGDLRLIPVVRHQSGTPFARTFVRTLSYGTATIKAEPVAANRTPNITIVDLRAEKAFRLSSRRLMGFVDVYNAFNTNAVQTLTTSSGGSWLRPSTITGPRVLRFGARLEW